LLEHLANRPDNDNAITVSVERQAHAYAVGIGTEWLLDAGN
jgi:ferredoxin-NADP reductase